MKLFILLLLLMALETHGENSGNAQTVLNAEQWEYLFDGNTTVRNDFNPGSVSFWSLSGILRVHGYQHYQIMQLLNLKTTAYNGAESELTENIQFVELSRNQKILGQPFLVLHRGSKVQSLRFLPNDTKWSKNIKKAFASLYDLDLDKAKSEKSAIEKTIYGDCLINYTVNDPASLVTKTINHTTCQNGKNQARYPLGYLSGITVRSYRNFPPKIIKSNTDFQYKTSTTRGDIYRIVQTQVLELKETSIPKDISNDISKYTDESPITYEFDDESTVDKSNTNFLDEWYLRYNHLKATLVQDFASTLNSNNFNILQHLQTILTSTDSNTLTKFFNSSTDSQMRNIFLSLIPSTGTSSSIKFLRTLLTLPTVSELHRIRVLAQFPFWVRVPFKKELLKDLDDLFDVLETERLRDTYVLSFANFVGRFQDLDVVGDYVGKYFRKFSESDSYSLRMPYLLGLMNMGPASKTALLSIIKNTTESRHIRSLATYALKPFKDNSSNVFANFWPIVKNSSEAFELRIAALSLLLDSNIGDKKLNVMLEYMNGISDDPVSQHVHHYFYTSLKSDKGHCDPQYRNSSEAQVLSKLKPPISSKGLVSSHHHLHYSDASRTFCFAFNTHLVANPVTNFISVYHFEVQHFLGNRSVDSVLVRLKMEGLSKEVFREAHGKQYPVKELYRMLQEVKPGFRYAEEPVHIELVVFYDTKAVFLLHVNEKNLGVIEYFVDEVLRHLANNDIVLLKEYGTEYFISDFGTELSATIKREQTLNTEFAKKNTDSNDSTKVFSDSVLSTRLRYKWNSQISFISKNPIADINHGISKIYSSEHFLKLRINYNLYNFDIKWHDNDFHIDSLIDRKYGVFVDRSDQLKIFCPKCAPIYLFPKSNKYEEDLSVWLLLKTIKIQDRNCFGNGKLKESLRTMMEQSDVNYSGYTVVQPIVVILYTLDYLYYYPTSDICSLSAKTVNGLNELNQSQLILTFDDPVDENFKVNTNFNVTLTLNQRRQSNEMLNQWTLNVHREEFATGSFYKLKFGDRNNSLKLDVHSKLEFFIDTSKADMFSLKPAEPILIKTAVEFVEEDSKPSVIQLDSLFLVSNELQDLVLNSDYYKICQNESKTKFKYMSYTPPTKSCYTTSMAMSTYDDYEFHIQIQNIYPKLQTVIERSLASVSNTDNDVVINKDWFNASVVYSAINESISVTENGTDIARNYKVPKLFLPRTLLKSGNKFFEELTYSTYGLESVCIVTSQCVKTFTDQFVDYRGDDPVLALIECKNNTRFGFVSRAFNNGVTFKMWTEDAILVATKKSGKGLKVKVNEKSVDGLLLSKDLTIDFWNDGTLYVKTHKAEIYLNDNYALIRIKSAIIDLLCGSCNSETVIAPKELQTFVQDL